MFKLKALVPVVAGAAAAVVLTLAPAAHAVTPGCAQNGFCGTQKNINTNLVFDVFQQKAASNNKVIAYTDSATDKATDFINYHPTSGPAVNVASAKAFQYAPNGVKSHLCLSDPGPGFGASDLIVLRPCNNSVFQVWVPTQRPAADGWFSWRNMASHQFITEHGLRGQLTGEKDGTVGSTDNNQPTFDNNQLWQFTQS